MYMFLKDIHVFEKLMVANEPYVLMLTCSI